MYMTNDMLKMFMICGMVHIMILTRQTDTTVLNPMISQEAEGDLI